MRKSLSAAAIVLAFGASGCAPVQDHVLFVTNTSLGFDADSATGSVDLGFNRQEGVAGPGYDGGELPPIYAYIDSDGGLFDRNVDQQYATGDAARLISGGTAKDKNTLKRKNKEVFFVGTRTSYGLHIGVSETGLASVSLGIKRQEISFLPLGRSENGDADIYPSALASFGTTINTHQLGVGQLIATGDAAESLAMQPALKSKVLQQAGQAFAVSMRAGYDENSNLLTSGIQDPACLDKVNAFLVNKYPDDTPDTVLVIGADDYKELRQEIVANEDVKSACNQFAEK
jgi:hypothetical protein